MPGPATKYVDTNGAALHCLHTGPTTLPGTRPALDRGMLFLLIHGAGRNAADWRRQLAGLGDRHGLVALDLPAHGRSPGVEGLATVEAYADLVEAFCAAALGRPPVLVGWSMGASIALVLAARHPGRYPGLALVAGVPAWRPPDATVATVHDVVRGRLPQQFDTALFSPATGMDVMREVWTEQVKTDPRVLHGDLRAAAAFDETPLLPALRLPTLVIHGADDKLVPADDARAAAARIPGARVEVLEHAGHAVQVEQAARVNELLAAFGEGLR